MLTKSSLLENVSQGRVFDGYLQKQNVQLVNPYWFTIRIPFCCRHGDIFRDHQYHGCAIYYELFLVTPSRFSPTIYRHSINVSTFQILLPPACESGQHKHDSWVPEPSTEQDSTFHKHHKGSAAGAGVSLAQVLLELEPDQTLLKLH